jgi:hypothetical protein
MEFLATAASPLSCNPSILWSLSIEDIVFDEISSRLQRENLSH